MEFAGKGNRKPQLDIDVNIIELDAENPRLVPYINNNNISTQYDLIQILYDNFETEEIALSLVENGYFDEEPIIIVPNKKPADFNFSDYDNNPDGLSQKISELIEAYEIDFTVVEGNRRVSTIKLISNTATRNKLGIEKTYPKAKDQEKLADITSIPCIVYEKREDVSAYLGVRHIMGALKWEAYAKAAYIADFIKMETAKGLDVNNAIKKVQDVIGDRTDTIKKQYVTYKLLKQAKDDLDEFDIKPLVNHFSLLTVAYNSPTIREYIGVKKYSEVDFTKDVVPNEKLNEFEHLLTWIYGNNNKNEKRVLSDSRQITNTLSHVVKYEAATEYLIKEKDLDGAFERANGEKHLFYSRLMQAEKIIKSCLQFANRHKNDLSLLNQIDEIGFTTKTLKEETSFANN